MNKSCLRCKYGYDTKPGGQKPSPGTVWCSKRSIQMAKNREMPCFIALKGLTINYCIDCKRARVTTPSGSAPQLSNIWCDKKHIEMPKRRTMDCFE